MQLTGANKKAVVPHVGTWIEMPKPVIVKIGNGGRASRRHVD